MCDRWLYDHEDSWIKKLQGLQVVWLPEKSRLEDSHQHLAVALHDQPSSSQRSSANLLGTARS